MPPKMGSLLVEQGVGNDRSRLVQLFGIDPSRDWAGRLNELRKGAEQGNSNAQYAERTKDALTRRTGRLVRRLEATACANFFAHAGYAI